MKTKKYIIKGGLYLVIDPSMELPTLLSKTEAALKGGIDILQIWNHWNKEDDKQKVIQLITALAYRYSVPVLINENVELLMHTDLDGIHFDTIPDNYSVIKQLLKRDVIIGITCGNDIKRIEWAIKNQVDYISFCSVFPSSSVTTCDVVDRAIIRKARAMTDMPIFLSGGIDLNNMPQLKKTKMDGVAVVSGIMSSVNTEEKTKQYQLNIQNNKRIL